MKILLDINNTTTVIHNIDYKQIFIILTNNIVIQVEYRTQEEVLRVTVIRCRDLRYSLINSVLVWLLPGYDYQSTKPVGWTYNPEYHEVFLFPVSKE